MSDFEFGDPATDSYGLRGVVFINDEKPIGFVFVSSLYYTNSFHLRLTLEPSYHSIGLYNFFKRIFMSPSAPMSKSWGNIGNDLNIDLELKEENRDIVLQNIEKEMSVEWRKAFDAFLSAKK